MLIPVLKGLKPTKEEALPPVFYIRQLKQTANKPATKPALFMRFVIVTDGNSFPSLRGDKGCVKANYMPKL